MRAGMESQTYRLPAEKEHKEIVNVFTFICKPESALNDTPLGGLIS